MADRRFVSSRWKGSKHNRPSSPQVDGHQFWISLATVAWILVEFGSSSPGFYERTEDGELGELPHLQVPAQPRME